MGNLLGFINIPFGYLMKLCLYISGNYYVIALFFFTLVTQLLLLPLGIKQQKNMVMQRKLRPKEMAIRKKYAGRTDKATQQKMMLEIQDMQKSEGYNQLAGCLPMLIPLLLIFILYAIVRQPITYSFNPDLTKQLTAEQNSLYVVAYDTVEQYKNESLIQKGTNADYKGFTEELKKTQLYLGYKEKDGKLEYGSGNKDELTLTKLIQQDYNYFNNLAKKYDLTIADYNSYQKHFSEEQKNALPNFNFAGMTMLDTPNYRSLDLLLIFPILVFVTSFLSGIINRKYTMTPETENNPMVNGWFMKWGMPAMSAIFAFSFPAAISVYWIWRTVTGTVQPIVLNHFYPMPTFTKEEMDAAEKELKKTKKKKKVIMIEVDEDDDSYRDLEVKDRPLSSSKKVVGKNKIEMLSADDDDEVDTEENKDNKE